MRRFIALLLLPAVCVLALVFITPKVPETYRAWRGHGEVGQLSVEAVEYGGRCRYFGDWAAASGNRRLNAVRVDDLNRDDCKYKRGDQIRTLFVGNAKEVYVPGDYAFWFAVGLPLLALGYLIGLGVHGLRRRRET